MPAKLLGPFASRRPRRRLYRERAALAARFFAALLFGDSFYIDARVHHVLRQSFELFETRYSNITKEDGALWYPIYWCFNEAHCNFLSESQQFNQQIILAVIRFLITVVV